MAVDEQGNTIPDETEDTGLLNNESDPTLGITADTASTVADTSNAFISPEATVQHQLDTILNSDSPLMKTAESRAKEQANRSGLLSSSLAVGAGQRAVIDAATPIATSDAGTYAKAAIAGQAGAIEEGLLRTEGDVESNLSKQKAEQDIDQVIKEAELTGDLEEAARAWEEKMAITENEWSKEKLKTIHENELAVLDHASELSTEERLDKHNKALQVLAKTNDYNIEAITLQGFINGTVTAMGLDQAAGTNYADGIMKIMAFPDEEMDAATKTAMTTKWNTMYENIGGFVSMIDDLFSEGI